MDILPAETVGAAAVGAMVGALLDELAPGHGLAESALAATAREVLSLPTVTGLVARQGNRPVGLLMLNECAAIYAGGRFGEITELWVAPDLRSGGLARTLLERACEIGREKAWTRLEVGAPSQPAWHRTLGF
jgi:ribosomal protein S18 acetylase RimI-like enzyme